MDKNAKTVANEKLPDDPHFYPEHFGEGEFYEDQHDLEHSQHPERFDYLDPIEHLIFIREMNAGTPPYEESRHYGWGDDNPEHEGYDEPCSEPPDEWDEEDYEDDDSDSDGISDESSESGWDEWPEYDYDWQMADYDKTIRGWEHLEILPRFAPMRG